MEGSGTSWFFLGFLSSLCFLQATAPVEEMAKTVAQQWEQHASDLGVGKASMPSQEFCIRCVSWKGGFYGARDSALAGAHAASRFCV